MTNGPIGLIGGTGLGEALLGEVRGTPREIDTPFGRPSGPIIRGRCEGAEVAVLARHGEGHLLSPTAVPYRANIYALKSVGVTRIIASGATGSLREDLRPRDLVVVDQVIDKTTRRAGTFFDEAGIAAHVELAEPFCPAIRRALLSAAGSVDTTVHDGGTYVCMEGPAFSTAAESRMHRAWGGDLIGMTCMPEARLAREAEMCYAMLALPTDYDCWRPHDPGTDKTALLSEILGNLKAATANSIVLIKAVLRTLAASGDHDCPCQHALDLGIWSDRGRIPAATVERLGILVARHLK
ncbi:MAG: S-methyl-5'-thioadenosine phosphorylase [Phycisphaerae bacterium]